MTTVLTRPTTEHRPGKVEVLRHPLDADNLEWSTLRHLGVRGPSPGLPKSIAERFLLVMRTAQFRGTVYVNPIFTVRAERPTREFIRQARRAQLEWLKRFRSLLHSRSHVKRTVRRSNRLIRQLAYVGVMIADGKHVFPDQWPKGEPRRTDPASKVSPAAA